MPLSPEHLSLALRFAGVDEAQIATVAAAIEERRALVQKATTWSPANPRDTRWVEEFERYGSELLESPVMTRPWGECRTAVRILLSQASLLVIPNDPLPRRHTPPVKAQTDLPVQTKPPEDRSASVFDHGQKTPLERHAIHGMCVEKDDGGWVLECDVLRGNEVQLAVIMDNGADHAFQRPMSNAGSITIDLQLPEGRRPTKVVIVAMEGQDEVGRGMIVTPPAAGGGDAQLS